MTRLKVTQVRSLIDRPKDQKATVRALGLHRMHDTVLKEDRPEIRGMVAKVRHLVRVEEVADTSSKKRMPRAPGEGSEEGEDS